MSSDNEALWIKDRMQQMREHREHLMPAFEQIWNAAQVRRTASTQPAPMYFQRLALVSAAVALMAAILGYWSFTHWQQSRRIERDYTAVEGVLLTYWQAPSDALLEPASFTMDSEE